MGSTRPTRRKRAGGVGELGQAVGVVVAGDLGVQYRDLLEAVGGADAQHLVGCADGDDPAGVEAHHGVGELRHLPRRCG